jgi:protein involved in polysaccharide export with SLBB domain
MFSQRQKISVARIVALLLLAGSPSATDPLLADEPTAEEQVNVSAGNVASSHQPSLQIVYGDGPVYNSSSYSAAASSCNCGHCLPRVDRNGDGMIDELAMKNGIGPCNDRDCERWQCPYTPPFNFYGPGEYAGPARVQRIGEYRLRSGDTIDFTFLVVGLKTSGDYRLVVGDELLIESEADKEITRGTLERGLRIQPDGTITLRLIGQIHAAGQTIDQLREVLNDKYQEFFDDPNIDVTPVSTGTAARQIREAISGTGGFDPQRISQTITPSGELRLPRIGSVQAQGLTLDELKQEINLRYDDVVGGLEVEPSLREQAPHNIFVLGEVNQPGRFDLDNSPTTVLGAIAMAGGHVPGANLRQVVVFRRGENYELLSTLLDVRGAILGREACPADEIWLRDGDVIVLPSTPIRLINNLVRQVFTEGVYGVIPFSAFYNVNAGAFN